MEAIPMKMKTEETIKLIKYVTGSVAAVLLAASVCVCRRDYHSPDDPGHEEGNCADNSEAHDHICDHDDLVSSDLSVCRISCMGIWYCSDPISV